MARIEAPDIPDDPNALWRAVHGYVGTSPEDVREAHRRLFERIFALRADHYDGLNEGGRRLFARCAFAAYLDARTACETAPIAALFVVRRVATPASREPVQLSRLRKATAMERFRARWLEGEA